MWFVVARVLFCGLCTWRARQEYAVKKSPLRMGTFKCWWLCCWILMFATLFLNWASILWSTMGDVKRSVGHLSVSDLWGRLFSIFKGWPLRIFTSIKITAYWSGYNYFRKWATPCPFCFHLTCQGESVAATSRCLFVRCE